jgi:flagellar export protein FliJ
MQVLEKLIRIRRRKLDEVRREITVLEGLSAQLRDNSRALEEEIRHEQGHAARAGDTGTMINYGAYARQAIARRENIARSLADVESQVIAARDVAAMGFQEIKRLETVVENERSRRQAEAAQREQAELDEIGLQQFTARTG